MSKLTLAALEDIGYVVDPSKVRRDVVVDANPRVVHRLVYGRD